MAALNNSRSLSLRIDGCRRISCGVIGADFRYVEHEAIVIVTANPSEQGRQLISILTAPSI